MKITFVSKQKAISLSAMESNSFGIVHEIGESSSWHIGDLVYKPVASNKVCNIRDKTITDRDNYKVIPVTVEEFVVKYKE
jgi:hypothetical protein